MAVTEVDMCMQTGLLGMVPFDPMGQISDKNRQSEVRNGRCSPASFPLDR